MLRVFTAAELPHAKAPAVHVVLRRGTPALRLPECPALAVDAEAAWQAPLRLRPVLAQPTAFSVSKAVTLDADHTANTPRVST